MNHRADALDNEILRLLGQRALSPSHDRTHTDVVKTFALLLQERYGGDIEVLVAAARLHDLGRDDPNKKGVESIKESVIHAKALLGHTRLPKEKIDLVVIAIKEHDQPDLRPNTLEGRILKDADFLAGFGARGILRTSMWAGETREGMDGILERLRKRMPHRILGLEFEESREYARKSMALVNCVLDDLDAEPSLPPLRKGRYVLFEGISGSGKDTQIQRLLHRMQADGLCACAVREPTECYRELRSLYAERTCDGVVLNEELMCLLLATRYRQVKEEIEPALANHDAVIANRSFLSTIVYQDNMTFGPSVQQLLHTFVPSPDLVLLFDLEPEVASRRLKTRIEGLGEHEQPAQLHRHRPLFRDYANRYFGDGRLVVIDAGKDIEDVELQVSRAVNACMRAGEQRLA